MTHQYDLIIFGATSFVGQILCKYLITAPKEATDITWAIAGRSQEKMEVKNPWDCKRLRFQ